MTADLVAFLRARLDEDEAAAHARRGVFPSPRVDDDGGVALHVHDGGHMVVTWYRSPGAGTGDMAALRAWADADTGWTSERVLRDVEARRRIVDNYAKVCGYGHDGYTTRDEAYVLAEGALATTIKILAAVYEDHPDYQEAWRLA